MNPLVEAIMKKRGVESLTDLSESEKATFERWQAILGEEVTVDTIKQFCESQVSLIEEQFANIDNSDHKNTKLLLLHSVYRNILNVLEAPAGTERASLEAQLTAMLAE